MKQTFLFAVLISCVCRWSDDGAGGAGGVCGRQAGGAQAQPAVATPHQRCWLRGEQFKTSLPICSFGLMSGGTTQAMQWARDSIVRLHHIRRRRWQRASEAHPHGTVGLSIRNAASSLRCTPNHPSSLDCLQEAIQHSANGWEANCCSQHRECCIRSVMHLQVLSAGHHSALGQGGVARGAAGGGCAADVRLRAEQSAQAAGVAHRCPHQPRRGPLASLPVTGILYRIALGDCHRC